MQLTTAQLQTLKASILANTNVIASGPFAGTQVKDVPNNADGRIAVATWYNLDASPTYKVWQTDVPKATIRSVTVVANYTPTDAVPAGPSTDLTYSNRAFLAQLKQANALFLITGDGGVNAGDSTLRGSFRDCMRQIPTGTSGADQDAGWGAPASPGAVRLAMMRLVSNVEKLFSVAGSGAGNEAGQARGSDRNPDVLVIEGDLNGDDVQNALNS